MSRKILLIALFGLLAIGMIIGCSSDDDTPTGNDLQTGDPNDPELELIEELFDELGGYPLFFLMSVFDVMDSVNQFAGAPAGNRRLGFSTRLDVEADSILFTYHANSGYWYLYFSSDTLGYSELIIDSVQFMHGTTAVQWPDSALLTGVNSGGLIMFASPFDTVSGDMSLSMVGDLAGFGDVEIDGGGSVTFAGGWTQDTSTTCTWDLSMSTSLQDIELNLFDIMEFDGCPWAGSLTYSGNVSIGCTGDTTWSFSDHWMLQETFNGNLISVVIESSTHRWTFTDTCYSQAAPIVGGFGTAFTLDR